MTYYKNININTKTYVLVGILGTLVVVWIYLCRHNIKPLYSLF